VTPGSPASKLGLRPGDVITQINVRSVTNAADVAAAMANVERGTALDVAYIRGAQTLRGQVRA
jgi:S1-C subfamily serine protease